MEYTLHHAPDPCLASPLWIAGPLNPFTNNSDAVQEQTRTADTQPFLLKWCIALVELFQLLTIQNVAALLCDCYTAVDYPPYSHYTQYPPYSLGKVPVHWVIRNPTPLHSQPSYLIQENSYHHQENSLRSYVSVVQQLITHLSILPREGPPLHMLSDLQPLPHSLSEPSCIHHRVLYPINIDEGSTLWPTFHLHCIAWLTSNFICKINKFMKNLKIINFIYKKYLNSHIKLVLSVYLNILGHNFSLKVPSCALCVQYRSNSSISLYLSPSPFFRPSLKMVFARVSGVALPLRWARQLSIHWRAWGVWMFSKSKIFQTWVPLVALGWSSFHLLKLSPNALWRANASSSSEPLIWIHHFLISCKAYWLQ